MAAGAAPAILLCADDASSIGHHSFWRVDDGHRSRISGISAPRPS